MNMKTVKKHSEIILAGIAIEMHVKDGTTIGLTLKDASGSLVTVQRDSYGLGVDVLIPAPPKMVKRHQVKGKIKGVAFCELFDESYLAIARVNELGVDADPIEVTEVEIPEEG